MASPVDLSEDGATRTLWLRPLGRDGYEVRDGDTVLTIGLHGDALWIDGRNSGARWALTDDGVALELDGIARGFQRLSRLAAGDAAGTPGEVRAPMHGILTAVFVAPGQMVAQGERLAVLEAMKMQHEITADSAGRITTIPGEVGAQIAAGDPILSIEVANGDG
jgi:acetyl/propionyl-CoA carboxylase alpha subunit